jgi:NifU-like protein
MTFDALVKPFPWSRFSKKVILRIDLPYCIGFFTEEDASQRDLHLAHGAAGAIAEGNRIEFFWLVDKTDGVIIDSRFQAFGNTALVGAAEIACELVVGKNYDQAKRITADLIDKHVREKPDIPSFPEETFGHINLVIDAIEAACEKCTQLPLAEAYVAPPVTGHEIKVIEGGYPGFMELSLKKKLAVIEEVLNREVRPYIELDAGGITVLNLVDDKEVIISYSGSCTSCHSATGATLSYIQQTLRAQVHPDLIVTPDL